MTFPLRGADGVFRLFLTWGFPLKDAAGRVVQWFGTNTDVDEIKRVEEALLEAKAAAEAANAAKSQFLANMSHELRTPMNAILGMIDVALPKAVDPSVQDCLQTAKGSADLLLTLLNDLLDSAKIESGKLELESAPFSLRRMLDQITRVLSVRASEKDLAFHCRVPEGTPDSVTGDRMRLQQVLLNLAGNAIKFTERGEVEISLRVRDLPSPFGRGAGGECRIKIASPITGSPHASPLPEEEGTVGLEFAVRDTGIGIPASDLELIFQPFAQADASMARRFGGTGLGLSICKSLVEMMDGRIWVESESGKGSTFYFTLALPLAKELPSDVEVPDAVPVAAHAPLRILLVEDNPANQKLASYILHDRGHAVEIAGDGQEAVYLTESNRYDAILMDVQMPGMNGLEATAAIRRREGDGSRVPIIAMTAYAMKGDRDRCLDAGMDGYITKPVKAEELIGLVERLTEQGSRTRDWRLAGDNQPSAPHSDRRIPNPQSPDLVFDLAAAVTHSLGKYDLFQQMVGCFFAEVDPMLEKIRTALLAGDAAEVAHAAHRLKGTISHLGAPRAWNAAQRVEKSGHHGDMTAAAEAIRQLEEQLATLKPALAPHRRAGG
jgi:signal transduction histidine kinase/CheY-like chemotaxis protein/HPt (histidine-containing phosphotransfer) domain-containing protein